MKRIYNLFAAILLLCCSTLNAQSTFNVGDLCYRITSTTDKTVEVIGLKDKVTDEPTNGPTEEPGVYINETFASSFGVFSTVETVGNTPWIIDYKTAKATSYVDGVNNAAESWLISTPVDFTNETEAYVAFDYIIRYSESGKVAKNHQLLISSDYAGDPAAATWTDLPYGAVEGSDWTTFYKANVAVPAEFLGKSGIVFALRYTATTKAGTWEVKNFKVAHGTAAEPEEPEEEPEYTIAEALAAYIGIAKPAVVKGYIVGTVNGQMYTEGCCFSATAEVTTNILIADNIDEKDPANCMPVQLPSGAVRNALNLVANPGNYKKQVTLTGSLEKYFGVTGLKSVSKYVIDGVTPEEPETPDTPDTPVVPSGENLLANGSFEDWSGSSPIAWGEGNVGHNATIAQSNDARTGNYSIAVAGNNSKNVRLATKIYVLAAGTYTFSIYVKANGGEAGHCRIGYVPVTNGTAGQYKYETSAASAAPAEWTPRVFEFTLTEQTEVAFVVMNNKAGNGASFLVDDASLICTEKNAELTAMRSTAAKDSTYKISIPASVVFENEKYRVTGIGNWAFMECYGLESVDITDGINSIGYSAFDGCNRLKTVYISNTIETIDDYAFNNCTNILEIKIGAIKAITCSDNIFEEDVYNNATLYIPKERGFAYAKVTPWNKFHSVEMDFTDIHEVKGENTKVKGIYDLQGRKINNPTKGIYIIDGKKVFIK